MADLYNGFDDTFGDLGTPDEPMPIQEFLESINDDWKSMILKSNVAIPDKKLGATTINGYVRPLDAEELALLAEVSSSIASDRAYISNVYAGVERPMLKIDDEAAVVIDYE